MTRHPSPREREDLQVQLAQPGRDGHGLADKPGRNAIAVALECDERRAANNPLNCELHRKCGARQPEQSLALGNLGDRCSVTRAPVTDCHGPPVKIGLGLTDPGHRCAAPPRARHVLNCLLR